MRALSNLINLNQPDLVLFVGEALVGNDAGAGPGWWRWMWPMHLAGSTKATRAAHCFASAAPRTQPVLLPRPLVPQWTS